MRRTLITFAITFVLSTLLIPIAAPAGAVGRVASLQATIQTNTWIPPSPSPVGIAWWADRGRLIVVDADVEETVGGISHYAGVNTWEISTDGTVQRTSTTDGFSVEPTDVAADGDTVYLVDDNADQIFVVNVGPDGDLGTGDDTRTSVSTHLFGVADAEGLAFGDGDLFVSDGIKNQVYRIDPGSNGLFDGTDDRVSCFDTYTLGMRDPEGVTMAPDPLTGNLFYASRSDRQIAESTASGELVDLIDVNTVLPPGSPSVVGPGGIAVAPASDDPSRNDLYVVDRGLDNDDDPSSIDGKIYEIELSAPASDLPPVVASPGRQAVVEGETVNLQIVAADPNDDVLTYTSSTLPPGLSIDAATGLVTGAIAAGAAGGGLTTYSASIRVADGPTAPHTFRTVNFDVTNGAIVNNAPSITNPGDQTSGEGNPVSLAVVATDPDAGNVHMYSATGLPPGLWMDCQTGVISGTISSGAMSGSPYTVRVSVSDQLNPGSMTFPSKWDAETFTWTVTAGDLPPAAPTGLTITPETDGLFLDWSNNSESDLAGYNVYRMQGATRVLLNGTLLTHSKHFDTGAPVGQTSAYEVTAVDAGGHESAAVTGSGRRGSIFFRGASTATARLSSRIRFDKPAGVSAGDVMIAAIHIAGLPSKITLPAGWTKIHSDGTAILGQYLYWKRAGASEPATYQFDFRFPVLASGAMVAYGGSFAPNPIQTWAGRSNNRGTNIPAPSVTTSVANEVLVGFFGITSDATIEPPSGMVERAETTVGIGPLDFTIEASDDQLGAAGPTGVRTAVASRPGWSFGQVVALMPSA